MRRWVPTVVVAALATVGAQPSDHRVPALSYEDSGACPFECCTYREWSVTASTLVRVNRDDAAPIAFRVTRGQKVIGVTGVVITTRLGVAVVRRRTTIGERKVSVAPGESLDLLHYMGEGYWKFWLRGEVDQGEVAGKAEACTGSRCDVQVEQEPETVWWAKIRDARGREGWTRELKHFGGIDACG
jgi:hypothetical protein